jgi:hypothetical protein
VFLSGTATDQNCFRIDTLVKKDPRRIDERLSRFTKESETSRQACNKKAATVGRLDKQKDFLKWSQRTGRTDVNSAIVRLEYGCRTVSVPITVPVED